MKDRHQKITVRSMLLCAIFAALAAVGAFIKIPLPLVPATLQTAFVALAGMLLGSKRAALSMSVYVLTGLIGIPVFTRGGGIGYVLQPTFGYLLGFIVGAYLIGYFTERMERPTFWKLLYANLSGLGLIYAIGMVYYYLIANYVIGTPIGIPGLILYCFLMTLPGDILSAAATVLVALRLLPICKKYLNEK